MYITTQAHIDAGRKPYVVNAFVAGVVLIEGFDTLADALARYNELIKGKHTVHAQVCDEADVPVCEFSI